MPFKRKIVTPQAPKRSTRKIKSGRQKLRAADVVAARKARPRPR
jgi:hypothetical protein